MVKLDLVNYCAVPHPLHVVLWWSGSARPDPPKTYHTSSLNTRLLPPQRLVFSSFRINTRKEGLGDCLYCFGSWLCEAVCDVKCWGLPTHSLVNHTLLLPQRWMYCITSKKRVLPKMILDASTDEDDFKPRIKKRRTQSNKTDSCRTREKTVTSTPDLGNQDYETTGVADIIMID